MANLIDRDVFRQQIYSYYACVNEDTSKGNYRGETLMAYEVADMIEDCLENAPKVDAVPVVRCKDCEHWGGTTFGFACKKLSGIDTKICMGKDHFCSYGKRKDSAKMGDAG